METPNPHEIFEVPADVYVTYRALYDRFGEDYGLTRRVAEFMTPLALGKVTPDDIAISRSDRADVIDAWEARKDEAADSLDRAHIIFRLGGGSIRRATAAAQIEQPKPANVLIMDEDELVAGASLAAFINS